MKTISIILMTIISGSFLASCQPMLTNQNVCRQNEQAIVEPSTPQEIELLESKVFDGQHIQKAQNLLILVDDSLNLLQCQGNQQIRQKAFDLIDRIDASLSGISLNKGIRVFGPHSDRTNFSTTIVYGMAGHQSSSLTPSIITQTPDNPMLNPLMMGLESSYQELKNAEGNTAIIVLSDFENFNADVYPTLEMISDYYDERVCLYGIFLGDDKDYNKFLAKTLGVDLCGFYTSETTLASSKRLTDFLDKVFYDTVPLDSPEPVIEKTVSHEKKMQEIHEAVQHNPVPEKPKLTYRKLQAEKELRVELKTQFDLGKSTIQPLYLSHLQAIAEFMKKHNNTTTVIEGHTCDLGTEEYNLKLSQQRADSVKQYLVDKLGVNESRISTIGYGESRPKADNSTKEGRERNRRAEAVITATIIEEVEGNSSAGMTNERFVTLDSQTLLDNQTGLMWGRSDNGSDINWKDAEKFVNEFKGGGFSDWRLATQEELMTLYADGEKNNDGYSITDLISLSECCVWSSDYSMGSSGIVSFKTGKRPWGFQADSYKLRALPVRSTKPSSTNSIIE